jgi:hypothetical protein
VRGPHSEGGLSLQENYQINLYPAGDNNNNEVDQILTHSRVSKTKRLRSNVDFCSILTVSCRPGIKAGMMERESTSMKPGTRKKNQETDDSNRLPDFHL